MCSLDDQCPEGLKEVILFLGSFVYQVILEVGSRD
jgi:hypothetical protein